jgi:hypothetical protein
MLLQALGSCLDLLEPVNQILHGCCPPIGYLFACCQNAIDEGFPVKYL